jgi:hypothetical protein
MSALPYHTGHILIQATQQVRVWGWLELLAGLRAVRSLLCCSVIANGLPSHAHRSHPHPGYTAGVGGGGEGRWWRLEAPANLRAVRSPAGRSPHNAPTFTRLLEVQGAIALAFAACTCRR